MKKLLIIFIIFILPAGLRALSLEDDYFKGISGARGMALGGAFGALADTADAAAWNPAGLAAQKTSTNFAGHWTSYWGEASTFGVSCSLPMPTGVVGLNYFQEKITDIPLTSVDSNGRPQNNGYFYNSKTIVNVSYAYTLLSFLDLGLNAKFYTHRISDTQAKGQGVDVGLLYRGAFLENAWLPVNVGLTVFNALPAKLSWPGSQDEFCREYSLALAYPFKWQMYKSNLALEINQKPGKINLLAGVEVWLADMAAVRLGRNSDGLTLGLGLKFENKFSLDVAYFSNPDLGANYQVTLGYFLPKI